MPRLFPIEPMSEEISRMPLTPGSPARVGQVVQDRATQEHSGGVVLDAQRVWID